MTALRTTRSLPPRLRLPVAALVLAFVAGCGGPPAAGDGSRPPTAPLPRPTVERIDYNTNTRTLTLYQLPESGRWLVWTPDRPEATAVGPAHILAEGTDPVDTYVAYRRPSGRASGWVALSDIIAARATNASVVR